MQMLQLPSFPLTSSTNPSMHWAHMKYDTHMADMNLYPVPLMLTILPPPISCGEWIREVRRPRCLHNGCHLLATQRAALQQCLGQGLRARG